MNIKHDNLDAIPGGWVYLHYLEDGKAHWAAIQGFIERHTGVKVTYSHHRQADILDGRHTHPAIMFYFDNAKFDPFNYPGV